MTLSGKSLKGKNRIKELGAEWMVIAERESVMFSRNCGPWALIVPVERHVPGVKADTRWINLRDDRDFIIVKQ